MWRVCCQDLLENGKTTGQAARLLYEPARREKLEAEAAKAKLAAEQSKAKKKAGGKAVDSKATKMDKMPEKPEQVQSPTMDEAEEEEEEEETDEVPVTSRHSFSLVCYGLPNLVVVAQPSKS